MPIGQTHFKLFPTVWGALKNLTIPDEYTMDNLIITSVAVPDGLKQYMASNGVNLVTLNLDYGKMTKRGEPAGANGLTEEQKFEILEKRNYMLSQAIKGGYDFTLSCNSDIVAPKDGLVKLMAANKDFISGWGYEKRAGSVDLTPNKIDFGEVYEVMWSTTYFTLESKTTFAIPYNFFTDRFNISEVPKRLIDLRRNGIRAYIHPGVFCEHLVEATGLPFRPGGQNG